MLKYRFLAQITVLVVLTWMISACYKDAGENVQPTSNRVNVRDIASITPAPTTPVVMSTPTSGSPIATKVTLAPTITPADNVTRQPTTQPQVQPSFTPNTNTPSAPVITTPGMSDIQPSPTVAPTSNSVLQPTPTGISVELDPCVHVVQSGDTLYSIAQNNNVLLDDLIAANPSLLANEYTPLQIGWELQIPGCAAAQATSTVPAGGATAIPGAGTTHIVQAGDTVYSIAQRYGVSVDAIIQANNLNTQGNVVYITVGQELVIPPAQ